MRAIVQWQIDVEKKGLFFRECLKGVYVRAELRMFGVRLLLSCTGVSNSVCRLSGRKQIDGLGHLLCGGKASTGPMFSSNFFCQCRRHVCSKDGSLTTVGLISDL